jgi:tetratricopeptide (TPR) repeat protein
MLIPILIIVIAFLLVGAFVGIMLMRRRSGKGNTPGDSAKPGRKVKRPKEKEAALREAQRRLAHNPHDVEGLLAMGDIKYSEEQWAEAYKIYGTLVSLIPSHTEISVFETNVRWGKCAQQTKNMNEALRGYETALRERSSNFEANLGMGQIEYSTGAFEKAIPFLNRARQAQPDNEEVLRLLGLSCFRLKKYKEAAAFLKTAVDMAPEDREALFTLAECYYQTGNAAGSLKIYRSLRSDPALGPSASLAAGSIDAQQHQLDKAIEDFQIGLKAPNIRPELALDIRYRLAVCYLHKNDIANALVYLRSIQATKPNYKDVPGLISRYAEVNANQNLQIYMMGNQNEFQALCKNIVRIYYPHAKVKIGDVSMEKNDWVDIQADVDTPKWSDNVMFRFVRAQGSIGEIIVRDFHAHLKEVKSGKGICVTVGRFTDQAKDFTGARMIDLVEKPKLLALLNKISVGSSAAKPGAAPRKK